MITKVFKQRVIDKLKEQEKLSGLSAARFATKIGVNKAQWSRLKKGEVDAVLADSKFITLARENGVELGNRPNWKTAKTPTFEYITSLLSACQSQQISLLLVDFADIGKSHTAKHYCKTTRDAIYMDCSQVKSKQLFVRELARQFGVNSTGKYADVYSDLVFFMNTLETPLVVLDEAGDLKYDAFLELKALWNATEGNVAWFMMGADGLKAKITRAINCQKVGYTEIFRRYGSRYRKITPNGKDDLEAFKREQAMLIAKANAPAGVDVQKLVQSSQYSLTNLYNQIRVLNQRTN